MCDDVSTIQRHEISQAFECPMRLLHPLRPLACTLYFGNASAGATVLPHTRNMMQSPAFGALTLGRTFPSVGAAFARPSRGVVRGGVYPHETPASNAYILGHSGVRLVLVDTVARWTAIAPFASELTSLQRVWVKARASEVNFPPRVDVTYLSEFISGPAQKLPPEYAGEPDEGATLIY